jgi:hypothetical protein
MKMSQAFPSRFLKPVDLDGKPTTLTMAHVKLVEMGHGADKDSRPVLYFLDHDKGLVLNKTNSTIISDRHGDDSEKWHGQPIMLVVVPVEFGGRVSDGIRVRLPKPDGSQDLNDEVPF